MTREELDQEIERTPNGKEKMALLRKGWEMADREKDYDGQIKYRLEYMHQNMFYDDGLEIYIFFPEVLRLHDERIKEHGYDPMTYDILWAYKTLLENVKSFYHISIQQYENLWQDCKERFLKNNYSLRPLYEYSAVFYGKIDEKRSVEAYKEFCKCKRGTLSDCYACEIAQEVEYLLERNEFAEASRKATALLEGRLSCTEQPEGTWGSFLRFYNTKIMEGDRDYVEPAQNLCEKLRSAIERKGIVLFHIPDVLIFYSMEKPEKALNYYKKNCSFFENNRNPDDRYWFAIAALCFLKNLKGKKTYKMTLSGDFLFYNKENVYDVEMLWDYYLNNASDIAEKMDKRNGTTVFADTLQKWLK